MSPAASQRNCSDARPWIARWMAAAGTRPPRPSSSSTSASSTTPGERHARRGQRPQPDVPAGKICVLVGPSGCGKTTSLKMVNRLIEPTSGRILIDGEDAATRDVTELRRGIGYVIQQVGLFPHQTIGDNVAIVPRLLGWPAGPAARACRRAADASSGLDPARYRDRYPSQLSGGERQRVGVARALAADPPDHAHGRAVRRRRPDRPRPPPERVPAAPGGPRQDDPVRDPRHRRGDQDGRPGRGLADRRPPRPVRHAGRDPGRPRPTSWPASSAPTGASSGCR